MITSFEVGAIFAIKDEATATLRRMADQVLAFDRIVIKATENLALLGKVKFPGLSGELKRLNEQAEALKLTFGNVTAGMNSGVASTTAEVNTLAGAWGRVAAEARAAAASMRTGIGGAAGAALPNANLRARAAHGRDFGSMHGYASMPLPGGMHARAGIGMGPAIAGGGLLYGMAEEGELEDAMFQMAWHAGLPNTPENKKYFRDLIQSTASATGFDYKSIAEAATDEIRLLKGAGGAASGGLDILPEMLRAAAVEARVKPHTSLTGAMDALIQQAHMAQEYGVDDIKGMAPLLAFLSTTNPATLPQMVRAASYAMPTLHSGLHMKPEDVLYETTAIARAGATNTKSGTWVQSAFENAMPHGNKKTMEAMQAMGLIDSSGRSTILDPTGDHLDIDKLFNTLDTATRGMSTEDRTSMVGRVFGKQGARGIDLMMSPAVRAQTGELKREFPEFKNRYGTFFEDYEKGSPIQQGRQAWMDLTNVLADLGTIVLPPVVSGLRSLDDNLKSVMSVLPKQGVSTSGVAAALTVPLATGGLGLKPLVSSIWNMFGGAVTDTGSAADKAAASVRELNGSINSLGGVATGAKGAIGPSGIPGATGTPERHSMNFIPPPHDRRPIVLTANMTMDSNTVAKIVEDKIAERNELPDSASSANGVAYPNINDWNPSGN